MTPRTLAAALATVATLSWTAAVPAEGETARAPPGPAPSPVPQAAREAGQAVIVEGAPLPLRASPGMEKLARTLAADRAAWAPLPGLGSPAVWFEQPPTVWVVDDLGTVPGPGPGAESERWAAGFADPDRNLVAVLAGPEGPGRLDELRRTLRHELAHLALERAAGGGAPRWLHEGYAQLAAGDWNWQQAWRLRGALMREGSGVLERLALDFPEREDDARTAYLLSYTAVQELVRRGGPRALTSFFEALRDGATVDAALRDVYGMSLVQFEKQWRESVKSRYGWLYLLSRASVFWLLLTLALIALGWRRWRHERERWEELRRREAEEGPPRIEGAWWVEEEPDEGPRDPGRRPPTGGPDR